MNDVKADHTSQVRAM